MPNALQQAGAAAEPSNFAPLNTDRIFTGLWSNRNPLRDAATSNNEEKYYGARQDSILGGYNSEISSKLTLRRRPGLRVYNANIFTQINRFYSFNTFTLTDEAVRVLADTATDVWDVTNGGKTSIWHKSAGAGTTYFVGVGNNLYFTNGVENKQWNYTSNKISNWGIVAPSVAPTVYQEARSTNYPAWGANHVYGSVWRGMVTIYDVNTNTLQRATTSGVTGTVQPTFSTTPYGTVADGSLYWQPIGNPSTSAEWHNNYSYSFTDACIGHVSTGATTTTPNLFVLVNTGGTGLSGATLPIWTSGLGSLTHDGALTWMNCGVPHAWSDYGANTTITVGFPLGVTIPDNQGYTILDPNGYLQSVAQSGKSGATGPTTWNTAQGAQTTDNKIIWINQGGLTQAATGAWQYGYAYVNSTTMDISNMSPASVAITLGEGNQIVVQGTPSTDPQVDQIYIYRTAQGESSFLFLAQIANTPGSNWTYIDTTADSGLNIDIQAQVSGEGMPLPIGATCLEYHLGRIWAAVGNVVYASSGPDAVVSGASGNAGFDTSFTCQSKVTRFWVNALGIAVFTVRDCYLITGDGATTALTMTRWIENIPLLSYDCLSIFLTTAYIFSGKQMVLMFDPSSGIVEVSQPIADLVETFNPKTSYLTFHSQQSGETALYIADGTASWYRFAPTSAPESGSNWSTQAQITGGTSAVQSVETSPGEYNLLIGPPAAGGPILMRDVTMNTDNGAAYPASTRFGSVVVAQPGELAALAWMTLEAQPYGTAPALSVLLSEINGEFESVPRSRQDPPNLPPSQSLYSNRHSLMQNQMPTWCRHFQFTIDWPAEDAANELLTFTIFGQLWQEMRSQ